MIRIGFGPAPVVFNSRDLLNEIFELGDYEPEDVIAHPTEKAASGSWKEAEITERGTDDTICVVRAKDEERISAILKAARIEQLEG